MNEFESDVVTRLVRIETKIDNGISSKLEEHSVELKELKKRTNFLEKGLWIAVGVVAVIQIILNLLLKNIK